MRGSYTMEAAFVMSISLFALLSLLFLAFYLHDIQCLQAEMNRVADQAAAKGWEAEELEEALKQSLGEVKLLFLSLEEREMAGASRWQQDIYFPIPFYSRLYFQGTIRDGYLSGQVSQYCPEQFIRRTEAGKEMIE